MTYFLLHALAAEWDAALRGAVLADAWTQSADELSLAFDRGGEAWTVRVRCEAAEPLLFRTEGVGRARRNTATLFEAAHGQGLDGVRTADRDRFVFFDLADGGALRLALFGPRPNAFLTDTENLVQEAFLNDADWAGQPAPAPRPASMPETPEQFAARWRAARKTVAQAVAAAVPLFDRTLAEEAVYRAGLDPFAPPSEVAQLAPLFAAVREVVSELAAPEPRLYWRGRVPERFALVPLHSADPAWTEEGFETVDTAVRVYAKRRLALRRFEAAYRPLERALAAAHRKRARSAEAMLAELAKPSRADRYEAWGHLLMAQAAGQGPGQEEIVLDDLLGDGAPVTIPLDPARSAVENAERYYAKARQTRAARRHAEARWETAQAEADAAGDLLARLRALDRYADLEAFLGEEREALARFTRPETVGEAALPYHRFDLDGWEVRVGKNAKSNAALTTRHAGPHDLWLHARGVPGSHVVIRRPGRTAEVPKAVVERAARLAAHFSKARTQTLAPVTVTERKYVRPIKGGAPGLVHVDREEVILVEPGLPG